MLLASFIPRSEHPLLQYLTRPISNGASDEVISPFCELYETLRLLIFNACSWLSLVDSQTALQHIPVPSPTRKSLYRLCQASLTSLIFVMHAVATRSYAAEDVGRCGTAQQSVRDSNGLDIDYPVVPSNWQALWERVWGCSQCLKSPGTRSCSGRAPQ